MRIYKQWHALASLILILFLAGACGAFDSESDQTTTDTNVTDDNQGGNNNQNNDDTVSTRTLRSFNARVLDGYESCAVMQQDLEIVGQWLVDRAIEQNLQSYFYYYDYETGTQNDSGTEVTDDSDFDADIETSDSGVVEVTNAVSDQSDNQNEAPTSNEASQDSDAAADEEGFTSNNQVEGVDEADFVKSDGTYIYMSYGKDIVVYDLAGNEVERESLPEVSTSSQKTVYRGTVNFTDELELGMIEPALDIWIAPQDTESIAAMLFNGNRIVMIARGYQTSNYMVNNYTRVLLYDVDTQGALTFVEDTLLNGSYLTGRMIDGQVYLVTSADLDQYSLTRQFSPWSMSPRPTSKDDYLAAAETLAQTVISPWAESTLNSLFADQEGNLNEALCQNVVQINNMRSGTSEDSASDDPADDDLGQSEELMDAFAGIVTFNMEEGLAGMSGSGTFLPLANLTAYASQDYLVLAGTGRSWNQDSFDESTMLITFSLADRQVSPLAVGTVPGRVLNQFSIDFHNDHLRVATTKERSWRWWDFWAEQAQSESYVSVLAIEDNELVLQGQVSGLGLGERIYAVRFMEDRGFVVTFRQIDPFYTLDLSDPTNPQQVGELKIPGFSNYLHPIDENHILAIGESPAEEDSPFWQWGLQVAVFDVSNMSDPQQKFKHFVENWSYSDATHDHLAFRYLSSRNKLILPLRTNSFDGFEIYDIDLDEGVTASGRVAHADSSYMSYGCFYGQTLNPRSMVFGDQLVTMKGHKVISSDLETLSEQWVGDLKPEETPEYCYPYYWLDVAVETDVAD